jgi:hypothetical protein
MTLDLLVPPLSFLVLVQLVILALAALGAAVGSLSMLPFWLASSSLTLITLAIALAWFRFGTSILPVSAILRIPLYVLWKLGIYASLVVKGKQKRWIRTERDIPVVHDVPDPTVTKHGQK